MAVTTFLAMTAAEIRENYNLPDHLGWMACHFSPYGLGLSNLPKKLPPGSLLILNDRIPIHGHDPEVILRQLETLIAQEGCTGLLLDFQQPDCEETSSLAAHLCRGLGCPVAVSESYAKKLDCPVFLPPLPHHIPLKEYLSPWMDREIWLELAMDAEVITLTEEGCQISSLPAWNVPDIGFEEAALHCHYHTEIKEDLVEYTLWRTKDDLINLQKESDTLGISITVGLYQELK